jgi:hypothetical protein
MTIIGFPLIFRSFIFKFYIGSRVGDYTLQLD